MSNDVMPDSGLISINEKNERLFVERYKDGSSIPTLQLGDGMTTIFHIQDAGGREGLGFSFNMGSTEVGQVVGEHVGKSVTEVGTFFQILTTNPDSLRVIIDKCELAIQALQSQQIVVDKEPEKCDFRATCGGAEAVYLFETETGAHVNVCEGCANMALTFMKCLGRIAEQGEG